MRIQATKPLFAWDELEDSPTLKTIRQLLEVIPDQTLLDSLRAARGRGRNDVPVHVAWGVLVLPWGKARIGGRRVEVAQPRRAVFCKLGSRRKCPARAISAGEGRAVLANLVIRGSGPTLPYPAFSPRQSAILFQRAWHMQKADRRSVRKALPMGTTALSGARVGQVRVGARSLRF
jgi:hypothetical protein